MPLAQVHIPSSLLPSLCHKPCSQLYLKLSRLPGPYQSEHTVATWFCLNLASLEHLLSSQNRKE